MAVTATPMSDVGSLVLASVVALVKEVVDVLVVLEEVPTLNFTYSTMELFTLSSSLSKTVRARYGTEAMLPAAFA